MQYFIFINFLKSFHKYIRMENLSNKIVWNAKFVFVSFSKNFRKYLLEWEIWATNYLKLFKNYLNTIFFIFIYFSKNFHEYIRMENQGNNNENLEKKYLENMRNNFKCAISGIQLDYKKNNQKRNHCWN